MNFFYQYLHCPFCIRVRMVAGYLKIPYESKVLRYDDEKTPQDLCGKKMLPIWQTDTKVINESLDIVQYLDSKNRLQTQEILSHADFSKFEEQLNAIGTQVHNLAMPYFIYTREFDEKSRNYFQKKKEAKRGPFRDLVKNKNSYIQLLEPLLKDLEKNIDVFYQSKSLSLKDVLIAAHLWGLYLVPEFHLSEKMHIYLQEVKKHTHFNYMDELWEKN